MMKRIPTTLLVAIVLFSGVTLGAATQPKFRPSNGGGAGVGRYVVTLTEEAGFDDPAALRQEIAQFYGAKVEAVASSGGRQFEVTMTYARARLLSSDPRVIEVAEIPLPIAAPMPTASPFTTASHLTPRTSSYGDNGQSGTYTYDGSGNITAIGADTFVYDTAQRLVSSVTRGVQENYTYDAYGNRTSATGAVNCLGQTNCAQTVTVDSNTNHLTTINGAAVTYDVAGNIKTIAATSGSPGAVYSYDALGMMTEATVGSDVRQFIYTADDERIAVRQGASWTWTVRDQSGKVLREFTSLESGPNFAMTEWHWLKDYVWRDGLLLATVTPNGTLHYHLDHLGTPRLVTDANGVKVAEHAYYPFGAEINLTPHETPEEPMKFTGHERDIVAGDGHTLDYMHARYYSAAAGRFLSVDPVLGNPSRPQSWNRYSYVLNSPLVNIDPTGRCTNSVVCLHYGQVEATLDASDAAGVAAEPPMEGTWEAAVDKLGYAASQFNAKAAKEWAKYKSGAYDYAAPDYNELAIAMPLAGKLAGSATAVTNAVPSSLARVIPGELTPSLLGRAGAADVFVTAAEDIQGMNASQLGPRLGIPTSDSYTVIQFPTPAAGVASPVMRNLPGFIGRGLTSGGAREFVVPNGPIPWGGIIRVVGNEGIP
jgi:RHS repeat-associated protein